ncbi:MAG: GspMb/PilO family protein [Candidatus Omnitrophota bacterium]
MKMLKLQDVYTLLSRLSKREKTILYVALSVFTITLLDRLIIYPISSKIKSLNSEIQEKELAIKKNLRIWLKKDKILAESARYSEVFVFSKSDEEELTTVLKEIETLANRSSVYLIDMKPAGLKQVGSSKRYMVNLNCEAQMEQLIEFMYNIENSNKILTIEKYQITPKARESSVAKCSMSIAKILL